MELQEDHWFDLKLLKHQLKVYQNVLDPQRQSKQTHYKPLKLQKHQAMCYENHLYPKVIKTIRDAVKPEQ